MMRRMALVLVPMMLLALTGCGSSPTQGNGCQTNQTQAAEAEIPLDMVTLCESIIGMTVEEADRVVTDAGASTRTLEIDGEGLAGTDDWRTDRINLAVANGIVTRAWIG
jgi:hypothetical protein